MVEHARRFDGIQAGHALNAGKLLRQYLQFSAPQADEARFEGTLTICTLHSLLTQCAELLKYTQVRRLYDLHEPLTETPNALGLTTSMIVENTFPEPLTGAGLLEHLRDALSHPAPDAKWRFRPTGFTTTGDGERIQGYVFTNSPWIKDDARYASGEALPCRTEKAAASVIRSFCRREDRKDFALEVLPLEDGRFDVGRDGQPYVPLVVARLPLNALISMTLLLAEALSRQATPV